METCLRGQPRLSDMEYVGICWNLLEMHEIWRCSESNKKSSSPQVHSEFPVEHRRFTLFTGDYIDYMTIWHRTLLDNVLFLDDLPTISMAIFHGHFLVCWRWRRSHTIPSPLPGCATMPWTSLRPKKSSQHGISWWISPIRMASG